MAMIDDLPAEVVALMKSGITTEFSTISAAGVPIDTPTWYFPSEGLKSFDIGTGLAYPAKAERARRNPKVGLFIDGGPDEPVVSIAGMAAVRDQDLQKNVDRYVAETSYIVPEKGWPTMHKAVWYWTRILIEVTPVRVLWWANPAAMDGPPQRWDAPQGTVYPKSDPAPSGSASAPSKWEQKPWREIADHAAARDAPSHLTLIDAEGYPLPIRVRDVRRTDDGFTMRAPKSAPWIAGGKATLTFEGLETFIGEASLDAQSVRFTVERALPFLPLLENAREVAKPSEATYEILMNRLRHEADRRGSAIPVVSPVKPEPTEGAKLRMARRAATPQANFG